MDRSNIEHKAFLDNFSKWTLTSLTIGPQSLGANTRFWVESFGDLPPLPRVDNVTIICHDVEVDCWVYFDSILTRTDLFPALTSVHVRPNCDYYEFTTQRWRFICNLLLGIRRRGLGPRQSFTFEPYQRTDSPCATDQSWEGWQRQ